MKISNPLAREGEEIAVKYLKKLGYKIIDRNFRARSTEIDIVAVHPSASSLRSGSGQAGQSDTLVFVEVKTRTSNQFGTPLEQITYWKLKSLVKAAQYYKLTHQKLPDLMRIDAVSVKMFAGKNIDVEHIKNISGF